MSHPVPWMEPEDLEETMTPEDIKKLATPETDMWEFPATVAGIRGSRCVAAGLSRSLEQRLTAAMMALENAAVQLDFSATGKGVVARNESFDKARDIIDSALASIRQMKEGK